LWRSACGRGFNPRRLHQVTKPHPVSGWGFLLPENFAENAYIVEIEHPNNLMPGILLSANLPVK